MTTCVSVQWLGAVIRIMQRNMSIVKWLFTDTKKKWRNAKWNRVIVRSTSKTNNPKIPEKSISMYDLLLKQRECCEINKKLSRKCLLMCINLLWVNTRFIEIQTDWFDDLMWYSHRKNKSKKKWMSSLSASVHHSQQKKRGGKKMLRFGLENTLSIVCVCVHKHGNSIVQIIDTSRFTKAKFKFACPNANSMQNI